MAKRRNIGLNALIEASRLTRAPTASDLGFALGPRINAGGRVGRSDLGVRLGRSEEHTSELQSLMRISYAVFCLKKKKIHAQQVSQHQYIQLLNYAIAK